LLARLFTLNGRLPQGAPTSPVLSNLAFAGTDKRLMKLAARYGVTYTRYADDLTFSSKTAWPGKTLLQEIIGAIQAHDWVIAKRKTRLTLAPHRMSVLGLVVNGEHPRLSKKSRNRIRLMRHLLATGNCSEIEQMRFKGFIAYANSIAPEQLNMKGT
jgi:RNA-directed DNA polymerase